MPGAPEPCTSSSCKRTGSMWGAALELGAALGLGAALELGAALGLGAALDLGASGTGDA